MALHLNRSQAFIRASRVAVTAAAAVNTFSATATATTSTSSAAAASWARTQVRHVATDGGTRIYRGPLAQTCRRLKMVSLGSFGLVTGMTPVIATIESSMPLSARVALWSALVGTSGLSTGVLGWCTSPYVVKLEESEDGSEIELETNTVFLQKRLTRVYDWRVFLRGTTRALAKWELTEKVEGIIDAGKTAGEEETVAETRNKAGRVVGRWIVRWAEDGSGQCRGEGNVVRYFNVHEELL